MAIAYRICRDIGSCGAATLMGLWADGVHSLMTINSLCSSGAPSFAAMIRHHIEFQPFTSLLMLMAAGLCHSSGRARASWPGAALGTAGLFILMLAGMATGQMAAGRWFGLSMTKAIGGAMAGMLVPILLLRMIQPHDIARWFPARAAILKQ